MATEATKSYMKVINYQLPVSTTRSYVNKINADTVAKSKKPLLSIRHGRNGLVLVLSHKNWTLNHWNRDILSGETIINRLGPDKMKLS